MEPRLGTPARDYRRGWQCELALGHRYSALFQSAALIDLREVHVIEREVRVIFRLRKCGLGARGLQSHQRFAQKGQEAAGPCAGLLQQAAIHASRLGPTMAEPVDLGQSLVLSRICW